MTLSVPETELCPGKGVLTCMVLKSKCLAMSGALQNEHTGQSQGTNMNVP